jgi:predicted RNA binding protein with dsRBD fold (UPF0201 family)
VSVDKINIEIDLAHLWVGGEDGKTFADYIAGLAATNLLREEPESKSAFRQRVSAITDEEIRDAIRPAIVEALTGAVQKTDAWGEPKGEPKTLREQIVEGATAALNVKREHAYNRRETLVEYIVREEIERAIRKELSAEMDKAKKQVTDAIKEQGAEVLAEAVKRVAGVRL